MGPLGNAVSSRNGHDINPLDEVLLVRNPKESLFVPLGKQASSHVVYNEVTQGLAPRYDQTHRRPQPVDLPRNDGGDGPGGNDQGGDNQGDDNPFGQYPSVQYPEMLEMYTDLQRRNAELTQAANQLSETQRQHINVLTQRVDAALRDNQLQQAEYNKLSELYKQAREQLLMTLEDKQSQVDRINTINALRRMDKILVLFKNIERRDAKRARAGFEHLRDLKRGREMGTQMDTELVDAGTQMGNDQVDMGTQMEVEPSSSTDRRGISIMRRRIQNIQRKVLSRLGRHSQNQRVRQLEQQVIQVIEQADQALESQDRQQIVAARENAMQVENIAIQNFQGNVRDVANLVGANMEAIGGMLSTGLRLLGAGAQAASGPIARSTTRAIENVAAGAGSALANVARATGDVAMELGGSATRLTVDAVAGGARMQRDMERGGGNFIQNAYQYTRNALAGFGQRNAARPAPSALTVGPPRQNGNQPLMLGAPNDTAAANPRPLALEGVQVLALEDAQYDDQQDVQEAPAQQTAAHRQMTLTHIETLFGDDLNPVSLNLFTNDELDAVLIELRRVFRQTNNTYQVRSAFGNMIRAKRDQLLALQQAQTASAKRTAPKKKRAGWEVNSIRKNEPSSKQNPINIG